VQILCLDLEGVLVPEIWAEFSRHAGIPELSRTTRDERDYNKLMRERIEILRRHDRRLSDIQSVIGRMNPLLGAREFVDRMRERFQVVILSDTYYEFAAPLISRLGSPTLFCHHIEADASGRLVGYRLRMRDQKRAAVAAFRALSFHTIACGDSYNDMSMLAEADVGILFRPPVELMAEYPQFEVTRTFKELESAISQAAVSISA
jgi:phosphoserine/homoserine phosphotransferase